MHDEDSVGWYIKAEHIKTSTSHRGLTNSKYISTERKHQAKTLYTAQRPDVLFELCEDRESNSASGNIRDSRSTAKAAGSKCFKVRGSKLRLRRMTRDATSDAKVTDLQSVVKSQFLERPPRNTEDFQRALRDLLHLAAVHIYICP